MIPKKIHFIWLGSIPRWVSHNIQTWMSMNPDYDVLVHNESSLTEFYKIAFDRVVDVTSKSDLVRLSVLEKHKGWYFDCDFIPLIPLNTLINDHKGIPTDFFITKQWAEGPKCFANGILGIGEKFEGWSLIHEMIERELYARRPLERTTFGPLLVTRFMQEYKKTTVGEWQNFYYHRTRHLSLIAYKALQEGKLANVIPNTFKVYTIHLWLGGSYNIPELEVRSV